MQPDTGHIECKQLAKIASLFVFASPDYNIYKCILYFSFMAKNYTYSNTCTHIMNACCCVLWFYFFIYFSLSASTICLNPSCMVRSRCTLLPHSLFKQVNLDVCFIVCSLSMFGLMCAL